MNTEQITPHFDRVREFHKRANHAHPEAPEIPSEEDRVLRAKLILEEALETVHALGIRPRIAALLVEVDVIIFDPEVFEPDLQGIADGCADLSVVTTGTLVACGIKDKALQEEVDQNNLLKFEHCCPECGGEGVTARCIEGQSDDVPGRRLCATCGHVWVSGYRRDDGKWIKPENHPKPDIARVLKDQGWEPKELQEKWSLEAEQDMKAQGVDGAVVMDSAAKFAAGIVDEAMEAVEKTGEFCSVNGIHCPIKEEVTAVESACGTRRNGKCPRDKEEKPKKPGLLSGLFKKSSDKKG